MRFILIIIWFLLSYACITSAAPSTRPAIEKLGTLECDMVEVTPVVFAGRVKLVEYVREDYQHRPAGAPKESYFRVVDLESGETSPPFAVGQHLCSALVDADTLYVFGVEKWGGQRITCFRSKDLTHWESDVALDLPGWGIFNTSVCKAPHRYVMAIEIDRPADQAGVPFTIRFAQSQDLKEWKLNPPECVFAKDRYTACPAIRYFDEHSYMVYLEQRPGPSYEPYVARSANLMGWDVAPIEPVLAPSADDRKIAPQARLSDAERKRIATAVNINNSDVDFCEFNGQTLITYSWGNQTGIEHLALARYPGPLSELLRVPFETPSTSQTK